jgi:FkbM family methyltransferase
MKTVSLIITTFILFFGCNNAEETYPYPEIFEGKFKEYKSKPLDLIEKFIPNNPVIFEAGAHYGIDSAKFSKKWPFSKIISFEPNPHAFEKLCNVADAYRNIFPYNLAIANFNGPGIFYVCHGSNGDNPEYEGASSLLPASEAMKIHYQGPQIMVNCVKLDDWCKDYQVKQIDFMWLDLEGMELQALECSKEVLKNVSVIYVETNFQEFRIGMTKYEDLKAFLKKSGFTQLAHWYYKGLQGNALFVKRKILVEFLEKEKARQLP